MITVCRAACTSCNPGQPGEGVYDYVQILPQVNAKFVNQCIVSAITRDLVYQQCRVRTYRPGEFPL